MWKAVVVTARRFLGYSPRVFGEINIEVLIAIAVPILIEVLPTTAVFRLILLVILAFIFADLASRVTTNLWGKSLAVVLAFIVTLLVGYGRVSEQFYIEAVVADYKMQRDFAAKYTAHDESLKRVVEHYDQLQAAQSLFGGSIAGSAEINRQAIGDIKNVLNNIEAIALPFGKGLKIKLAQNLYRILYPVPMRIAPQISITGLPSGVTATIINSTNLGFTVLLSPLSTPLDHFGIAASAEP